MASRCSPSARISFEGAEAPFFLDPMPPAKSGVYQSEDYQTEVYPTGV
jgi:hypothetical protein